MRTAKAGLVICSPDGERVLKVITLQYNPDSVTRSLTARSAGGEGGEGQRVSGAAKQTISFEAELDAADQLADPESHKVELAYGLHPYLAALEGLLNPPIQTMLDNDRAAGQGLLEIVPVSSPALILVWGAQRIVPVRLTELSVTEEAFDTKLNPIRAKVSFNFTVLGVNELGTTSRLGALAVGYQRTLERLSGVRGFGSMYDLGPGVSR